MNDNKIYGVLKAQVQKDKGEFTSNKSHMSHYNLITILDDQEQYQVNLDIQSDPNQPNVHMVYYENYSNPIINQFDGIENGFTVLPPEPNTLALDFLREELFPITDLSQIQPMSADQISTILDNYLENNEHVIVFGTKYSDNTSSSNHYGNSRYHSDNSLPSQGVDDVHMNQGSVGSHASANGIYQDGALFVKSTNGEYTAFFFSFQEQVYQTDDNGNSTVENTVEM